MRTLFTGEPWVHYGQIYVESGPGLSGDIDGSFAGQRNGLCGAGVPGSLFLRIGMHTGEVGFTVEWHDAEPPVDPVWQEVVEASFRPSSPKVGLCQWAGEAWWDLDLPELDHRVRYCAFGMDEARDADPRMDDDEPVVDRYLLQFWPAPPAEDRVVKQTSEIAAYWHRTAQTYPSAEELAERRRQARLADERAREQERAQRELEREISQWGGRRPTERLRGVGGYAKDLAAINRGLVDAIERADPDRQREIARTAARWAYQGADLSEIDWIAPALAALDRGDDLPPPFEDQNSAWSHLLSNGFAVGNIVPGSGNHSRPAFALPAIFLATQADPLRAALDAVWAAVRSFGTDGGFVVEEFRALLE